MHQNRDYLPSCAPIWLIRHSNLIEINRKTGACTVLGRIGAASALQLQRQAGGHEADLPTARRDRLVDAAGLVAEQAAQRRLIVALSVVLAIDCVMEADAAAAAAGANASS